MRTILRYLAATLLLVAGLVLGTTVLAAAGGAHRVAYAIAGSCYAFSLLGAHAALRWRAAPAATPLRRTVLFPLAFAGLAECYMLLGLPWPPTRALLAEVWPLVLAFVLTLGAIALTWRRNEAVRWLLLPLAAWGVWLIVRLFWWFPAEGMEQRGPGAALSVLLVFTVALTLIAAYWSARPLWHSSLLPDHLA